MIIADTHCDTLCRIVDEGAGFADGAYNVTLNKIKKYEHYTQVFACFIDPIYKENAKERCLRLIGEFYRQAALCGMAVCRSHEDIARARKAHIPAAILSVEGGECIESLRDLENYARLGVKMAALTWNYDNHIAGGVFGSGGLSEFGRRVVRRMDELKMAVDVSHLNERSFWEVLETTKAPPIASHSSSYSVCAHKRNLTDEQFREIVRCGGYVGINFYPLFLNGTKKAGIDDVLHHIDRFLELGGEDTIGIGADFDGVDCLPERLEGSDKLACLFERMEQLGYTQKVVEKITYGNFDRMTAYF